MSMEAPNLDSRTFNDLVREARDRIPRYTPDWTNFNDSDPGMTLVKLQAWLTETLLYEVNRVPELNYVKFLELLNVTPKPAKAAFSELHFRLKKLDAADDPLTFYIPKSAQVEADDPDLSEKITFETQQTLTAINAVIGAIVCSKNPSGESAADASYSLVSNYDAKKAQLKVNHSFYPFSEAPEGGEQCFIGLLLRPHRKANTDYSQDTFPTVELDLSVSAVEVYESLPDGSLMQGPLAKQALLAHESSQQSDALRWDIYTGSSHDSDFLSTSSQSAWTPLYSSVDESAALSRSGHLRPNLPENISQVSLQALPRSFWEFLGLKKPPTTLAEFKADLADNELDYDVDIVKDLPWEDIVPADALVDVTGACESLEELCSVLTSIANQVDFTVVPTSDWVDLDVGYSAPSVPELAMAWIRITVNDVGDTGYRPHLLNGFYLNSVPAVAAVTCIEETIGTSDGRPAQQFSLVKTPVYFDPETSTPDIQLDVFEGDSPETWLRVDDFYATPEGVAIGRDSKVYRLDPTTGVITFGNGQQGQIPVAGATIVVRRYRIGGGNAGNVGPNTLTKLKTSLRYVDSVTNPRAASGGADAETLQQAKLRAPHELKTRDRAVTADDFAFLARQTPGVAVHTAYALAQTAINNEQQFVPLVGAVTVVVLPNNTAQAKPQPSEAQLSALCAYLNQKRLITTELYVTGPRYVAIAQLDAEIVAAADADLKSVSEKIQTTLLNYFHPLIGGEEEQGWPIGDSIYIGNVYEKLLQVEGVKRVRCLNMALEDELRDGSVEEGESNHALECVDSLVASSDACKDILNIDAGYLPFLSADKIQLKVVYEKR